MTVDPLKLPADVGHSCKSCGASLAEGQEWCLQCGAGAPGSLLRETDWRPLAALAAAGVILLGGAATAAYAALNQQPSKPPTHVLIAQVPPPATTTAPTTGSTLNTPPPTTPTTTTPPSGTFGTSTNGGSGTGLPSTTIKAPKLPAVVPTPRSPSRLLLPTNTGSRPTTTTPVKTPTTGASEPTSQAPSPILLDTDAASTYNPSGYPESYFGDPGLAIDGEAATAWTAQVEPKVAPLMAAGLALDLKTARHLGTLEVDTTTPGMTVEIFGANGSKLPATIVDPAWTRLTASHVVKKKTATIKLGTGGKAFRFLVLWLTKAPESAVGTATAPGHVSINELVPYPPAK